MSVQYVETVNIRVIWHQACQDLSCLRKGRCWNKADLGLRNELNFIGVQEDVGRRLNQALQKGHGEASSSLAHFQPP